MNNLYPYYERIGAVLQVAINRSKRANKKEVGYRYLENWNIKYGDDFTKKHLIQAFDEQINDLLIKEVNE